MTTRVMIINFGPDKIEVTAGQNSPVEIWPANTKEFYVYDGSDLHIKEIKEAKQN